MSSSSSAAGLNRTRSLRQPTAGLGSVPKRDEAKKPLELRSKPAVATSASSAAAHSSRHMSPSRLPKPGAFTTAARPGVGPAATGASATATSTVASRSRPNSGIFGLSKSNTTAARPTSTQSLTGEGAEPTKRTRTLPTTSTRLTRPKSMVGPSQSVPTPSSRPLSLVSTGIASTSATRLQSPRTTTHARAKSTATSLTSTTTLRQPPSPSAESTASASTTATTATAASKRPLARANTVTARAPPQQRQASTSSSTANTSVLSATSSTTSTTTARPSSTKQTAPDDPPPRLRPAFNTLQQHYSPARNLAPKPLTASYLAPPTPSKLPANVALSTDTAKLQTELLQLHLLHRDADAVAASWHASARERLGRRFEGLSRADEDVGGEEVEVAETRNVAALKTWAADGSGRSLEDQIQSLDGVLSGLWTLSEPGGRYARVVRKFEKWVAQMTAAVEARRKAGGLGALMESGEVAFIRELDPRWKDEVSSLARKLDGWRRRLGQLEEGLPETAADNDELPKSSLVRILAGCRCQVYDMLAELDIMEQIERDAFGQEAAWIRRMNREDAADDTPAAGAIWRAF